MDNSVASASASNVVRTSLYIGDLHPNVEESKLHDLFSQVGQIRSLKVCRDILTRNSLGYGYVNFVSDKDETLAIEKLNNTPLNGKLIRVMWSQRDPSARMNGVGNVFVKNLDEAVDNVKLYDMFSLYGKIISCKVAMTPEGTSKCFGFVQFEAEESAKKAIRLVHGTMVDGKKIYVAPFIRKSKRDTSSSGLWFTNLYIKHLDPEITEDDLKEKFSEFGNIKSLVILRDEYGCSKGVAFVNYAMHDSAKNAIEGIKGVALGSKVLYVARAMKKEERERMLSRYFEEREEKKYRYKGLNIYVKNINDDVEEEEFKQLFSMCGTVRSAKIMRDENGLCRGFGFVSFSTIEEAQHAVNTFHGYILHNKPLYVSVAERKDQRLAKWKHQYHQKVAAINYVQEAAAANFHTSYYPASSAEGSFFSSRNGEMYHGVPSMGGLQTQSVSDYGQQYVGQENAHTMLVSGVQSVPLYQPSPVPYTSNYQGCGNIAGNAGQHGTNHYKPSVGSKLYKAG